LGIDPVVTDDKEVIKAADKVVFPGVGEASSTMLFLRKSGIDELLKSLTQPVLGIYLGLQLMCDHSEEGDTKAIGIFEEPVIKFPQKDSSGFALKVPHMGWNLLQSPRGPLFEGIGKDPYVYFVHGYYAGIGKDTCAESFYGLPFSAAFQKNNFYATQFHPEKSGRTGEKILQNFIKI
jgi:glutamine amidotransferase